MKRIRDVDSEDASDQDAPTEHRPDDVGRWVKDLIAAKAAEHKDSAIQEYFIMDGDSHDASCIEFFQKLNQEIRTANAEYGTINLDNGIIKDDYYIHIYRSWRLAYKEVADDIRTRNPRTGNDSDVAGLLSVENQQAGTLVEPKYDSKSEDKAMGLNDLEDLNALEARTINEQRRLTSGRVLYWWPKGTGP
ncbi:hypothetical protein N7486_008801 [Penicillium sp. IBT 16267x]|nr:hypothetical protein N7486_008801 [Penicillium sp. IBT 16267x]